MEKYRSVWYVLHFDINKTVILTDSIHNKSIEKNMKRLIL